MTRTPLLPDDTRICRAALRVGDLDPVIDFYRTVVGLSILSRTETRATLGAGETPLLVLIQDEEAAPRTSAQAGLFHTAFRVPSRAALGAALERIRETWDLDGASDHDVSEALYLTDPEDNGVEIYADEPRDAWPRADDGSIRMRTLPLDLDDLAADADGADTAPPETTIGHVHLEATSIDAARSFYVDTLGLRVQMARRGALFCSFGDYHHHVGLNTWNDRSEPAGGRGLAWFELVLPDADAIATARDGLEAADVSVDEGDGDPTLSNSDGIGIRLRAE